MLDLDRALTKLNDQHPRLVNVVECRFFAGMTALETAEVLSVCERTIERDWYRAKVYLYKILNSKDASAQAAKPGFKFGYIDLQKVMALSSQGESAKQKMQAKQEELRAELQEKQAEISVLKEEFERQGMILSSENVNRNRMITRRWYAISKSLSPIRKKI